MRPALRRVLGLVVAALAAGTVAATPAAATFGAPFAVSSGGADAVAAQVAVDEDGDAVFAWRRLVGGDQRVQARARSAATGLLSPIKNLSAAGRNASNPQVAVDADGDAVITWARFDGTNTRVQAVARSADGTLGAVQDLSDAGQDAFDPQVAIDETGNAVITWMRFGVDDRIQARARSSTGALSAVQNVSRAGQDAFEPEVAMDDEGDAVFTWLRFDGANFRAQTRERSAGGALSGVQTLSGSGQPAFTPQVGVDDVGNAVFTWDRSDGANFRIQARARTAAGALSPVQDLSGAGQNASDPQVAVEADGDAVFTWLRDDGSEPGLCCIRAQARARTAAGALSPVQDLSAPRDPMSFPSGASGPQVAVAHDTEEAVFTWSRRDGTQEFCCARIQARTRLPTGALGPVQNLSAAGQNAMSPQIAVDPSGDAVATWQRFDGAFNRAQGAVGP